MFDRTPLNFNTHHLWVSPCKNSLHSPLHGPLTIIAARSCTTVSSWLVARSFFFQILDFLTLECCGILSLSGSLTFPGFRFLTFIGFSLPFSGGSCICWHLFIMEFSVFWVVFAFSHLGVLIILASYLLIFRSQYMNFSLTVARSLSMGFSNIVAHSFFGFPLHHVFYKGSILEINKFNKIVK